MYDPYTNTALCVTRLLKEYDQHKRLIVALDFDDTVFDFHNSGFAYPQTLDLVRECQDLGFYIVLCTGAPKEKWNAHCEYLKTKNIHVDAINRNPITLPFGNDGKIYYNILLDDRAGLGQSLEILRKVIDVIREESQ